MSDLESPGALGAVGPVGWEQLSKEEETSITKIFDRIDESEHEERVSELRTCREKREAWNCRLHLAYDEETGKFEDSVKVVMEEEDVDEDDLPSHYTDPFYLSYGLDAAAIIGTVPFRTKFWPANPDDPADQTAAQSGTSLVAYFRKQNNDIRLRFFQGYFLYNDGGFANLTTYQPDASKYGTRFEQIQEEREIELMPAHARCPKCATTVTEKTMLHGGNFGPAPCPACGAESGDGACDDCGSHIDGACPACRSWLPAESWQKPITAPVPAPVATIEVPNAGPVYETFGWLECRRPVNADRIEDCPWIEVSLEVHRALAIAAFPQKEVEIRASSFPSSGSRREERFAREATSASEDGVNEREHMVTYRRGWL
ncbi:MAG TPA: hypothetical protein PKW35_15480, partial [Nannocystaceae bacterium]|nr:hypothetical protein [Nannocystaceae bacterium]